MNKFKIFISIYLVMVATISAVGQDNKASEILKASKATFENLNDFSANFRYALSNSTMRSGEVEKDGQFKYKEGMYFIEFGNQEIYCDLKSQWLFLKDVNEVNIMDYDPEEAISIESVYQVYESKAKPEYLGLEKFNNKSCHKILLTSLDNSMDYNRATLWINASTKLIEKAELVDKKQTKEIIEFTSIETNGGLGSNDFQFDSKKYPGVDIYDER